MLNIKSVFVSAVLCGLAATVSAQTPAPAPIKDTGNTVAAAPTVKKARPAIAKKAKPAHKKAVAKMSATKKLHKTKTASARKTHLAKAHAA